jgi:predicted dehydrogenase
MASVNVAFIGVGGMGLYQVKSFLQVPGFKIVAGADISENSRARFLQTVPTAKTYADYRELLKDKSIEAVVIATPTLFHKPVAIEAMQSGKAVLVEKPLARSVSDARAMIKSSEKTGKLLMVAHCRRFDSDWGTFAKLMEEKLVGSPVIWRHYTAGHFMVGSWFLDAELGGGPLLDGAVHNYDFANKLFGNPTHVVGSSIKLLPSQTAVDTATAIIHYESGNQVMVSWSWAVRGYTGLMEVLGPQGSILFGPGELQDPKLDLQKFGYFLYADVKREKKKLYKFTRKDMYVTQARHFLDCIRGKAQCLTPATEAIKAVAVGEAVLKACTTGGFAKVKW